MIEEPFALSWPKMDADYNCPFKPSSWLESNMMYGLVKSQKSEEESPQRPQIPQNPQRPKRPTRRQVTLRDVTIRQVRDDR